MSKQLSKTQQAIVDQFENGSGWRFGICHRVADQLGMTYDQVREEYAMLIADGRIRSAVLDAATGEELGAGADFRRPIRMADLLVAAT